MSSDPSEPNRRDYHMVFSEPVNSHKLWERDRAVLMMFPLLRLPERPTAQTLERIERLRDERAYLSIKHPIILTQDYAIRARDRLAAVVSALTGLVFAEPVQIEVLDHAGFGAEVTRRRDRPRVGASEYRSPLLATFLNLI